MTLFKRKSGIEPEEIVKALWHLPATHAVQPPAPGSSPAERNVGSPGQAAPAPTEAVHKDFDALYHRFRLHHSSLRTLSFSRLRQFLSATADVSVAYDQEQPICGHLNLIDYQSSRVNGIWAASLRHESKNPALIASVNRWLYWNEMTVYKAAGLEPTTSAVGRLASSNLS